jgi:hypothetical protein
MDKVVDTAPVRGRFLEGLKLIRRRFTGKTDWNFAPSQAENLKQPNTPPSSSYVPEEVTVGMSDVLQDEANLHGLIFRPKFGIKEGVSQVYQYGNCSVYWLDDEKLFVKDPGSGEWAPVAVDDLKRYAVKKR